MLRNMSTNKIYRSAVLLILLLIEWLHNLILRNIEISTKLKGNHFGEVEINTPRNIISIGSITITRMVVFDIKAQK